ncbi:MAG: hypothetical protein OXC19_05810 [Bryobacterales bacterium]|nr:hypothetical protein [Bryobacterales bacterium]
MSELIDPRPVFTIVMGCNGVGKSVWKRKNYDLLPTRYFDQDSIAGGIGDWNSPEARARTRVYVDAQIAEAIGQRLDFGTESTYSGQPGPAIVERVIEAGYRVEGVYFGTNDPQINIDRIEQRVFAGTGHMVDPQRIPERWRYSLSNLRRTAERFDQLQLLDNSEHDDFHLPRPVEQCRLERGKVCWQVANPAPWCTSWLQGLAHRQAELRRQEAKVDRKPSPPRSAKPLLGESRTRVTTRRLRETQRHRHEPDRSDYDFSR